MAGRSVLVVGASRGIGLGLVRSYAAEGWEVHATTRSVEAPGELGSVSGNVSLHALEVTDSAQVGLLAEAFRGRGLDVLIHNAGVKDGVSRERLLEVNVEAPMRVAEALLPA